MNLQLKFLSYYHNLQAGQKAIWLRDENNNNYSKSLFLTVFSSLAIIALLSGGLRITEEALVNPESFKSTLSQIVFAANQEANSKQALLPENKLLSNSKSERLQLTTQKQNNFYQTAESITPYTKIKALSSLKTPTKKLSPYQSESPTTPLNARLTPDTQLDTSLFKDYKLITRNHFKNNPF